MADLRTWEAWETVHQPWELQWWKDALAAGHSRDDGWFEREWAPRREFIKPYGRVIDIGCGPRPPFAPCAVIDPLADKYKQLVPASWWEGVDVFAQPAEVLIDGLRGDTIICWNCLDHAVGWRVILHNMWLYGSEDDARFVVATDFHEPYVGHPGFSRDEFMREINECFDIVDRREPFGRQLALVLKRKIEDWRRHLERPG